MRTPRMESLFAASPEKIRRQFETKFIPEPNSGCWLWEAATDRHGYGVMKITGNRGYVYGAHTISVYLRDGKLDAGSCVCHRCDNPCCVNPDHLFVGSYRDNMQDMARKQRHSDKRFGNASSEEALRDILSSPNYFGRTRDLANKYNVSPPAISRILNRK